MQCRMVEMRYKEVINICDGCRLGFVGDVEVLLPEGRVTALIVPGPCRFFGLFGRGEEFYVPWSASSRSGTTSSSSTSRRSGGRPTRSGGGSGGCSRRGEDGEA